VTIELNYFLVCCFIPYIRWDFIQLSLIFNTKSEWFLIYFLIDLKQWYFFKLNQSPTFFLKNVPVRRLYWFDVCTAPSFVLVRSLSQSEFCLIPTFVSVRRLSQSDVCTSPMFVSPTFVLSDVCTVRRLYCPTFVLSDVCTGTVNFSLEFPEEFLA